MKITIHTASSALDKRAYKFKKKSHPNAPKQCVRYRQPWLIIKSSNSREQSLSNAVEEKKILKKTRNRQLPFCIVYEMFLKVPKEPQD